MSILNTLTEFQLCEGIYLKYVKFLISFSHVEIKHFLLYF